MKVYVLLLVLVSSALDAIQRPEDLLKAMTLEQKIGQLFMIPAVTDVQANKDFIERCPYKHMDQHNVEQLIKEHQVGGVIFLGTGTKDALKNLVHRYQELSKQVPLLIGLDAEWGLSMRLTDGDRYPRNMTLGAIKDDQLIYTLAKQIGAECAELGVHINFAPVVDVNTNPNNPVIHMRSFGADKENVFRKAYAYMRGLYDAGVLSCAKHFPGHGDTHVDSHYGLPEIHHDRSRLNAVELWPFKKMIEHNVPAIMTAHIAVPALDPSGEPATLSKTIITDLLRKELGFDGLIITDGLGMQAILDHNKPGQLELKALLAGNDILLCPVDVPKAIALIKQAIADKELSEQELDAHVMRILSAKYKVQHVKVNTHKIDARALQQQLARAAITLVDERHSFKPLGKHEQIHVVQIGDDRAFCERLSQDVVFHSIARENLHTLLNEVKKKRILCIIMGINPRSIAQFDDGLQHASEDIMEIHQIIEVLKQYDGEVVFINFCSPYLITRLKDYGVVIQAYEYDDVAVEVVKEILLGKMQAIGELPI